MFDKYGFALNKWNLSGESKSIHKNGNQFPVKFTLALLNLQMEKIEFARSFEIYQKEIK